MHVVEQKRAATRPPFSSVSQKSMSAGCCRRVMCGAAPDVDASEQEQPHHVDEVPVPGGEFEAEMLLRREVPQISSDQAHDQKDRADDHMRAMESGGHEEGRAVDVAC